VSWNYCILRVLSEQERKAWIDAINEQIHYANLHDIAAAAPDVQDEHKSEDEKDDTVTDEEPLSKQEVAEELFHAKSLSESQTTISQKAIENITEQALQKVEECRTELNGRMSKMEKKIIQAITEKADKNELSVSWWMLVLLLIVGIVIGRFVL
jgi:hypothetical protein